MVHRGEGREVKVKRDTLIRHLGRVTCGAQITEAVFTDAFATVALTPDHLLLVVAPNLPGAESLPKAGVGLANLAKFGKALRVLAGEGPEAIDVDISVADHRLVIDEGHRGVIEMLAADPKTIGTRLEPETVEKLMAKAPVLPKAKSKKQSIAGPGVIPITQTLIAGVRNTFSLFQAREIELFVGPKGGTIQLGNENADIIKFASEELKAEEEYSLLFGQHFIDVLSVITEFSEAFLLLGGPGQFIAIADGGYRYVLSPMAKSADASK